MTVAIVVLLCVAVVLVAAQTRSPLSWAAIACAMIALLLAVLGGFEVSIR